MHRFLLDTLKQHIEYLDAFVARFDARPLEGMVEQRNAMALLQTLPGVDMRAAAIRLMQFGTNMEDFGIPNRLASWAG